VDDNRGENAEVREKAGGPAEEKSRLRSTWSLVQASTSVIRTDKGLALANGMPHDSIERLSITYRNQASFGREEVEKSNERVNKRPFS